MCLEQFWRQYAFTFIIGVVSIRRGAGKFSEVQRKRFKGGDMKNFKNHMVVGNRGGGRIFYVGIGYL